MTTVRDTDQRQSYEAPVLRVVGSVHELTLQIDKKYGPSDGYTLMGIGITNASP
ncbi:MAG: lasso RiPP family leader peptide-containing protein [Actinomycetota bacterium]|nr:lasso RiPP family leader peptide-containing protein [Actinomycetota bacterium]